MCSQPPRKINDEWRILELHKLISLIDDNEEVLGMTGGEPTLLGTKLFNLINDCKSHLPNTGLHILTNGRKFQDEDFANQALLANHHDLFWGIPLYSDNPSIHDHVVQAKNAFNETVAGIYNLQKKRQKIEIRVVLHKLTIPRLCELAYYIFRNMPFVKHIALMGLEPMGFGKLNQEKLWIDPVDYAPILEKAVYFLANRGLNVSIYNNALCTMPQSLWPYCRKSISDWKNTKIEECVNCSAKVDCAGFFVSAGEQWRGKGIKRIKENVYNSYLNEASI